MKRNYLAPQAEGYLLEAKACQKVCKELGRIADKLQRAVDREKAARQAEFEAALQYRSENEIQDDYGWEIITEAQYDFYLEIFREGRAALENTSPTVTELSLKIVRRILSDLDAERQEWKFSALSPAEQQVEVERAIASRQAWKKRIAEIKQRRGLVETASSDPTESLKGLDV